MILFSFHLPTNLRLDINLVKKRGNLDEKPFFPPLGKLRRVKTGSRISKYFRYIFEKDALKKIFGTNLAVLTLASNFIQTQPVMSGNNIQDYIGSPVKLTTEKTVQFPLKTITITQSFKFLHPGIDFDGKTGDEIDPIIKGKVEEIGRTRLGYGNYVIVDHGNGYKSLYAHLSKINAFVGQEVTLSTKLGEMGATGRATGDHLHLEVYENGKRINPLSILP